MIHMGEDGENVNQNDFRLQNTNGEVVVKIFRGRSVKSRKRRLFSATTHRSKKIADDFDSNFCPKMLSKFTGLGRTLISGIQMLQVATVS